MNESPATHQFAWDWSDLAFASKRPLNDLGATFIIAPRELSAARFKQIIKQYLPQGNLLLGLAKEDFVLGLENQPQFRMLQAGAVEAIIAKVNAADTPHKIYTLSYFQREAKPILEKLAVHRVLLVNGSWHHAFHNRPEYYVLARRRLPYEHISPFASEDEARAFEVTTTATLLAQTLLAATTGPSSEAGMLGLAREAAKLSYDYNFQTGLVLGRPVAATSAYELLAYAFNKVVPYQTYAMHHGATREQHFSPPHDLNHYDTVHAEVELLIQAQKQGLDLHGTTVFINLLPCPPCARMLSDTDIAEFVYAEDHSAGYAVTLLESAGKTVRRIVLP